MATGKPAKLAEPLKDLLSGQQKLPFDDANGARPAQPPATKLPIGSLAGLEAALAELAWMDARQKSSRAKLDADTIALTDRYAAGLVIYVAKGDPVKFDDRRAALEESAEEFCVANRRALLQDGLKSRDVNHGRFGWRNTKPAIVTLKNPGNSVAAWWDKLVDVLLELLAQCAGLPGKSAAFISPKPTVNRTKLLEAYEAGRITRAELARLGYKPLPAGEAFFLEPVASCLESSAAGTPADG
jgi:hypothetical protein